MADLCVLDFLAHAYYNPRSFAHNHYEEPMHRFATPAQFQRIRRIAMPISAVVFAVSVLLGLYLGLLDSPPDYQQGETVRIMYIHVPAAILSSGIYFFMAIMSACFLIWRHTLADVLARESAIIGAVFTLITLITGMLWGKPTWGSYWVWDARLTSVLILELLYISYIAVGNAAGEGERGSVASAWVALIGVVNLPIIKFSVEWWSSLHQKTSLLRVGGPSIDDSMLYPLLCMMVAFVALTLLLLFLRVDTALKSVKLRRLQIQRIGRKNASLT